MVENDTNTPNIIFAKNSGNSFRDIQMMYNDETKISVVNNILFPSLGFSTILFWTFFHINFH